MNDFDYSESFSTPARRRGYQGPRVNRVFYIVLALLFGGVGLHNFYAGRWLRGLLQLLLFGISFPLMLIGIGFFTVWIPILWALWDVLFVKKDGRGRWMS